MKYSASCDRDAHSHRGAQMARGVGGDLIYMSTKRPLGLALRQLSSDDPGALSEIFSSIGWSKPVQLFRRYLEECCGGQRIALVAEVDTQFAGYGTAVWHSPYVHFREQEIPEIKDLNVLPAFRRQGIGTALMDALESAIAERSSVVGIGVGLYANYGPAQRMYVLRGYVPDGRGAFYQDQPLQPSNLVPVDDALVLYMTKRLASGGTGAPS
jgi:GNAT superfamily N-acetyltransferase